MASHHHPHHHLQNSPLLTSSAAATCCCCCRYCSIQSPPPPPQTEPLLQAIASQLLQQHHQSTSSCLNNPRTHQCHDNDQNQQFYQQNEQIPSRKQARESQLLLSSLVRRIDALESSLAHFSTSSPAFSLVSSLSLRDTAARVIQTHFRAFLVRRSRALRHLKDLALIKSSFSLLKLSISNKTHFDFKAVSREAIDLLLKLDSIQGGDPMIRSGKKSISRDLVRFLELIDGYAEKKHEILYRSAKKVKFGRNNNNSRVSKFKSRDVGGGESEIMEKLSGRIDKIRAFSRVYENEDEDVELEGFRQIIDDDEEERRISINGKTGASQIRNGISLKRQEGKPRVKKSVSFADDGNVYWVLDNAHDTNSSEDANSRDGSASSDDHGKIVENIHTEVEGIEGLTKETEEIEIGGSPQSSSDGERNSRSSRFNRRSENNYDQQSPNKNILFSAPVPVKMQSRSDLMKERNALRIIT